MAKGKSLIDWCIKEMECARRKYARIPEEYSLAYTLIVRLSDARNKEIIDKAIEIAQKWILFKPTIPIFGTDDEWDLIAESSTQKVYANNRYFSLFKTVEKRGFEEKITYTDRNRVKIDGDEDYITFIRGKIDELIPITFPYIPEELFVSTRIFYNDKDKRHYIGFKSFKRNDIKREEIPLHKYYCFDSSLGGKSWEISRDKFLEVVQEYIDRPFWGSIW